MPDFPYSLRIAVRGYAFGLGTTEVVDTLRPMYCSEGEALLMARAAQVYARLLERDVRAERRASRRAGVERRR